MVFQQLCGINAIVFNAESIFEQSGFHDKAAAAAILGRENNKYRGVH